MAVASFRGTPRTRVWAVAAPGILLTVLGVGVLGHVAPVPGLDRWGHAAALARRTGVTTDLARAATWGGDTLVAVLVVTLAVALLAARRAGRRAATLVAAGAVTTALLRLGLAHLVGRPRPPQSDWAGGAGGFAFPSGHTTAATLSAALLAYALSRHLAGRRLRTLTWALALLYAAAVGWSRVWLGVHWPTDVLGGWCLGAACAALTIIAASPAESPAGLETGRDA